MALVDIRDIEEVFRKKFPNDSGQQIASKLVNFLETMPPVGGYADEADRIATASWIEELKIYAGGEYQSAIKVIQ